MKKELLLSFLLHIGGLSIFPLVKLIEKEPLYPISVYQVSLSALSIPRGATQLTEERTKLAGERVKKETPTKEKPKKVSQESVVPHKGKISTGGGAISTEGGEFKYSYYLDIILSKIGENWRNPYEGGSGKISVVVYFIIKRDGEIDKIRLERSSRNYYFDQAALRAVQAAKNLPPLPAEFERGWLGVYFEFEYVQ